MDSLFWRRLLDPDVVVFLIPIVAIIAGATIKIVKMVHAHNERIAMIQQGMHPDFPPDNDEINKMQ
jgi:hypothetical protein